jgi:signal transduction histidine kinase
MENRMSHLIAGTGLPSPALPLPLGNGFDAQVQRIVKPLLAIDARADGIAMISHELRNSLGVVRNAARLLRAPVGADDIERARVLIERHVGQMSRHIGDLLDPAALLLRREALRLSYVDLRTVVGNSIEAIAPDCARRGHRLVTNLPVDALWVHADAARLEQVFSNLLINAAKYTPDGGEITLTLDRRGGDASVRIHDSGIGIDPAQLTRIFGMFVQVDSTANLAEGGRGIGLAVVRELVEMHGGTVSATSAGFNTGSEFAVLLPALWARPAEECVPDERPLNGTAIHL